MTSEQKQRIWRACSNTNWKHIKRARGVSDISTGWLYSLRVGSDYCPICGNYMYDPTLVSFQHPKSKTIDHIQPISAGGTHTKDNVRFVCFDCNQGLGKAWNAVKHGNRPDPLYADVLLSGGAAWAT